MRDGLAWRIALGVLLLSVVGCGDEAVTPLGQDSGADAQPGFGAPDTAAPDPDAVSDAGPGTTPDVLLDTAIPDTGTADALPGTDTADAGLPPVDGTAPDALSEDVEVYVPENVCCDTSDGPGCVDEGVMECVCAELPLCCQTEWTAKCVEAAAVFCGAGCGGGGGGGGGPVCGDGACATDEDCTSCPADCGFCAGSGACCTVQTTPGCSDLATTQCVCNADSYCCEVAWDDLCVQQAGADCGAGCVVGPTCGDGTCDGGETCDGCAADCGTCAPGDCCETRTTPGCESAGIESCTCELDPFCCATAWDALCVTEAQESCGASCGVAPANCGDGTCGGGESCATCPGDCGGCGGGDCCAPGDAPGCGDPAVQSCVCGKDAFCCDTEWDQVCADAAEGCGASCGGGVCECAWASGSCGAKSAVLEIVALDVWAQKIPGASILVATGADDVDPETGGEWHVSLCGGTTMAIAIEASLHDPLVGTLVYDGQGKSSSVTWKSASGQPKAAWSITTDVRTEGGKQVRYYTLYSGLAHTWFAPSARPARRGTRFTLLRDGEQAWATVAADLTLASSQVNASSWWWTSEVEIVRDPAVHMWLSAEERWANTIMGTLEGMPGVERRVLVNQFYSQDGLLSNVTIDDELIAKAKAPADDFEFMGMANDAHGAFVVKPAPVDFAARLALAGAYTSTKAVAVASAPYPAFSGPIAVDTTKLPLGLGTFELPIASWHQKFMTIDDDVAFVGGMNFKTTDWDGSDHRIWNERRMQFDATTTARQKVKDRQEEPDFGPRKDYMVRLEGPAALDVQDVFRDRWMVQLASGALYADLASPFQTLGPAAPKADGQQVQVVATMPAPYAEYGILEALLRAIPQAKQYIFIEDQYFRAPILTDRIIERMEAVPNLVLIVVTNPVSEWSDPGCWQTHLVNEKLAAKFPGRYRTYALRAFDYVDTKCTFCIDEVDAHFAGMDLHSKLVIIDDVWIEVGSCNSNNRGLLYEGELAVVMHDPARVAEARDAVMGNIVGPDYVPGTSPSGLISLFDARAKKNQAVWDLWDDDGMDLNLNGDPLPAKYKPSGFLYPLKFGAPDDCFIENVGPDVS